jgi:hypothetical protein
MDAPQVTGAELSLAEVSVRAPPNTSLERTREK